jgi:DNA-binding protein H-NS
MASQIATIEGLADRLESGKENLSGPGVGRMPDWMGTALAPNAVAAREDVESVVQRNLRVLLGAQFTQDEGDRLIARAYNSALPEAENARRLRRLATGMKAAADARQSQADYYSKNGTITGWTGKIWTPEDFAAAIEGGAAPAPGLSPDDMQWLEGN